MRDALLKALNKAEELDRKKTVAELNIKFGFGEVGINKMISNLAELGYIKDNGTVLRKGSKSGLNGAQNQLRGDSA